MGRLCALFLVCVCSASAGWAQTSASPATDRGKATIFTADDLTAALAKLPADRPSGAARVFSLAPYNVNVEQRQPRPQGASLHEAQAEFFYVIEGSATLLTGGSVTSPTRNGTNITGPGIEGGVRQTFKKGDFMIVPSGVAHQFLDITAPVRLLQIYLPNAPQ